MTTGRKSQIIFRVKGAFYLTDLILQPVTFMLLFRPASRNVREMFSATPEGAFTSTVFELSKCSHFAVVFQNFNCNLVY